VFRGNRFGLVLWKWRLDERDHHLAAVIERKRAEVRRLPGLRVRRHAPLHVLPELRPRRYTAFISPDAAREPLDETTGEQRVSVHRTAVERNLIVERRCDDPPAPPRLQRRQRLVFPCADVPPLEDWIQRDPAVAGVQHHQDVLRWQQRYRAQPGFQVDPRSNIVRRVRRVDRDQVPCLDHTVPQGMLLRSAVAGVEQHQAVIRVEHPQFARHQRLDRLAGRKLIE
jgi:hypothetical protein